MEGGREGGREGGSEYIHRIVALAPFPIPIPDQPEFPATPKSELLGAAPSPSSIHSPFLCFLRIAADIECTIYRLRRKLKLFINILLENLAKFS